MRKALLLLLLLTVGAGCADRASTPRSLLVNAAGEAREQKSARVLISTQTEFKLDTPGASPLDYTTTGEGVFDFERQLGRITLDFSNIVGSQFPTNQTYLVSDGTIYIEVPAQSRVQTQGKAWIKVDSAALGGGTGLDVGSFGSSDPAKSLDFFKGISRDQIETVGSDTIRGVETSHFRVVISLDDLLEHVEETKRSQVRAQMKSSGIEEIPLEAWIDKEGLPRKWLMSLADQAGKFKSVTTVELYDYGTDVKVSIPSDDEAHQIASVDALAEILGYQPPR